MAAIKCLTGAGGETFGVHVTTYRCLFYTSSMKAKELLNKLALALAMNAGFAPSAEAQASDQCDPGTSEPDGPVETSELTAGPRQALVLRVTEDGVLGDFMQHRSHVSHRSHISHGSHASHRSHLSHRSFMPPLSSSPSSTIAETIESAVQLNAEIEE